MIDSRVSCEVKMTISPILFVYILFLIVNFAYNIIVNIYCGYRLMGLNRRITQYISILEISDDAFSRGV